MPQCPPQATVEPLSGTPIPETLEKNKQLNGYKSERAASNITILLILLGDAINELNAIKTFRNDKDYMNNAKTFLEEATKRR